MQKTDGRVAIITGSGKGIGRAIASGFAQAGIRVVLAARDGESVRRVANEIAVSGGRAVAFPCDVSKKSEVEKLVQGALRAYGRIDILVANAGVLGPISSVEKMSLDDWQKTMEINVTAVMLCNQAVLPYMIAQKYGRIQNMGSGLEYLPISRMAAYAASKGALHSFTRVLAHEVSKHNIKVNLHYPGDLRTQMNPKGKGSPEDAVGCAMYLAGLPDDGPTGRTFSADQEIVFDTTTCKNTEIADSPWQSQTMDQATDVSSSESGNFLNRSRRSLFRLFRRTER